MEFAHAHRTQSQKRAADVIGNAVRVMKIATGEIEEAVQGDGGQNPRAKAIGRKADTARATKVSPERFHGVSLLSNNKLAANTAQT